MSSFAADEIRYVAVGDSYTIGTGVRGKDAWPMVLTEHLKSRGIPIKLIANLGRNGFSSQNAIDVELPAFKQLKPNFATILIGTNDFVRGVGPMSFRLNLQTLLDDIIRVLGHKDRLIVLTLPDFSVTPMGKSFGSSPIMSAGLLQFNQIIKEEAKKRHLTVVDLFPVSQEMISDPALIAADGLHPSSQEHLIWARMIFPAAEKILKK